MAEEATQVAQTVVKTAGGGKKALSVIAWILMGGVTLISVGVLGYLGYSYFSNDGCLVMGDCRDSNQKLGCAPCPEGNVQVDLPDAGDADVVPTGDCQMTSYQLVINDDGYVTVPDCWKVTNFKATYTNLTDAELQNYMQPNNQAGAWPIFNVGSISISDGVSFIKISREPIFVTGGIGGMPAPIPDTATILLEPVIDYVWGIENPRDAFGIARTLEPGEIYSYHLIFNNEDYDPNGQYDNQLFEYYDYMSPMASDSAHFNFVGDENSFGIMDAFFEEACWSNTSGLCD